MLEKSCRWWLIWYLLFFCHGAEGQLQWDVKGKVTAYGQNLILFCHVENCCSEPAGWCVGPKTIILDVKTFSNDPKVKYHGTYNKDGFGVVIRNLSEADLNVTYRSVYGFYQLTPKYLLYGDVFRESTDEEREVSNNSDNQTENQQGTDEEREVSNNLDNQTENQQDVPDKDKEIDTAAITLYFSVVPIVVIMVGFIIGMAYCVYRSRIKKKRQKQTGTDEESAVLYHSDSQMENQQDKEENNFFRFNLLCQKIATNAVRLYFDSKVPGHTLESFLKQHKSNLTYEFSGYRCTKDQEAKLFPGGQAVVVSTDFDFSLLYKLIRNLLTAIPAPTCEWGNSPSPGHVNETDDIEIIRKFRNILSHNTEFAICDTDFSTHWTDLSQAIDRLSKGSLSKDVESMRTKTFDKCSKNEMEDMRKDLKEIREEFMELRQDVTQCIADNKQNIADNKQNIADNKQNIADNKQEMHNIKTRHIPPNIRTKEALDDPEKKNDELKDMKSCSHGCIDGIVTDGVNEIDRQSKDQARLMPLRDNLKNNEEMEDITNTCTSINEECEIRTGKSKNLDRLCSGHFKITPLTYRMSMLFVSMLSGAWVRWTEGYNIYTNFTFKKITVDGKQYFNIFSVEYPDYYVKMGMISWWVSCVKGDPKGCNDATWEIECVEYNNEYCYVLCTKDSNGNHLSAGSTQRMHGKRGDINQRTMFLIRESNLFNGDSNSQLMVMK